MDAIGKPGKSRRDMTDVSEREFRTRLRARRQALVLTVAVTDEELRTPEGSRARRTQRGRGGRHRRGGALPSRDPGTPGAR